MKQRYWMVVLFVFGAVLGAQISGVSVKSLMTVREFEAAGLNKLSKEELQVLDQWLVKFLSDFTQRNNAASESSPAVAGTYPIEAAINDETFLINGKVFKARTWCLRVNKGDRVKFIDGSASGTCFSAKFLDLRNGDVCEVWCE